MRLDNYKGKNITLEKYYITNGKIQELKNEYGLFVPKKK